MHKEENAHEDGIWSCAWGRTQPKKPAGEEETEKDKEESRGEFVLHDEKQKPEPVDFIVTGGLDDLVKVWDIRDDNTLKLRHQLKGHSLGVVSVAVSSDGKSEYWKCLSV